MVTPIEGNRQNPQTSEIIRTRKDFVIQPRVSKLEEESNQDLQGTSIQVVQNVAKAQDAQVDKLRFKGESEVEDFRGSLSGRDLDQVSGGRNIARLTGDVRPFDAQKPSPTPLVSLAPAEAAAIGFEPLISQPTVSEREAVQNESRLAASETARELGSEDFIAQERVTDDQRATRRVEQQNTDRVQEFLRQEQQVQQRQSDENQGQENLIEEIPSDIALAASTLTGPNEDPSPSSPASEKALSSRLLSAGVQPLSMQLARFTRLNRPSASDLNPNRPENASLEFPQLQEQQDRIQPAFQRLDEIQVQESPRPVDNESSEIVSAENQAQSEIEKRLDQIMSDQITQAVEEQRQTQKVDEQQQGQSEVGRVDVREQEDHFAGAQAVAGQFIPSEARGEIRGESAVLNLASEQGISNQIRRAVTSTPRQGSISNNEADDASKSDFRQARLEQKDEAV